MRVLTISQIFTICVICFFSISSLAGEDGGNDDSSDHLSPHLAWMLQNQAPRGSVAFNKYQVEIDGKWLPAGGPCEKLLESIEGNLGRSLTEEELQAMIPQLLQETGDNLVAVGSENGVLEFVIPKGKVQLYRGLFSSPGRAKVTDEKK